MKQSQNENALTNLIFKRISQLLERQNKTQAALMSHLGLSNPTYTKWMHGGASFMIYLDEIAEFFHVSTAYLVTGKNYNSEGALSAREAKMVDVFRRLPHDYQETVLGCFDLIDEQLQKQPS